MLNIEFTIDPNDPRFAAIMAAICGSVPLTEVPKPEKGKKAIEKPVQEVTEAPAATDKPVSLEQIREKIVEYTGKDKTLYTPKVKALLDKYGQKTASNLLKTDYEAFFTDLINL